MKKFIRNIALFSLPLLGILIFLSTSPTDKKWAFNRIAKDCRSGNWIYQRLYENEKQVDIAFIGTSKMMCDINDLMLDSLLKNENGKEMISANFGVCRTGENLHYLLGREVIRHKQPKWMIVEISTKMAMNSHFHFPYLAETGDIIASPILSNMDYPEDLIVHYREKWMNQREKLLEIEYKYPEQLNDPDHGFLVVPDGPPPDSLAMEKIRIKRKTTMSRKEMGAFELQKYNYESRFPKHYFSKIGELCKENDVKLFFLYLPAFGSPEMKPWDMDFYEGIAPVLIPPKDLFNDRLMHFDDSHLNQAGARTLTKWFATAFSLLMNNEKAPE